MKNLEGRLRAGMTRNGISPEAQDNIVHSISSFAMYGFPESHAASFALIAYASAYLKVHYLAAFTCALLNNQPMGFYSPAVLIKDAQRHGLRVRPIDVQRSLGSARWKKNPTTRSRCASVSTMRKGMRNHPSKHLLADRNLYGPFASVDDLARRVPDTQPQGTRAAGPHRRAQSARRGGASPRCALAGGRSWPSCWPAAARHRENFTIAIHIPHH